MKMRTYKPTEASAKSSTSVVIAQMLWKQGKGSTSIHQLEVGTKAEDQKRLGA